MVDIQKVIRIVGDTKSVFMNCTLKEEVYQKGAWDYVTRADWAVTDFLHKKLKEFYPDIGFLSEEEGGTLGDPSWILDPIDGTTNFMHGLSPSAVSLGLWADGAMQMGIIFLPDTNEMFWAKRGEGAWRNGERIFVGRQKALCEGIGAMEYNAYRKEEKESALFCAGQIFSACRDIRTLGSAAASIAYVACGRCHAFLGRHLKLWDYAAGMVLLEEAGGKITDENGGVPQGNTHILATNLVVHDAFLALMKEGLSRSV